MSLVAWNGRVQLWALQEETDSVTHAQDRCQETVVQGGGGTVQCSFGKCARAFHILCARQQSNVAAPRRSRCPAAVLLQAALWRALCQDAGPDAGGGARGL